MTADEHGVTLGRRDVSILEADGDNDRATVSRLKSTEPNTSGE